MQRGPVHAVLEQHADPRIALELAVFHPLGLRVHQDDVGLMRVEVEPHDRLARRAVRGVDGEDGVAQLGQHPLAELRAQHPFDRQIRITHPSLLDRRSRFTHVEIGMEMRSRRVSTGYLPAPCVRTISAWPWPYRKSSMSW